MSGQSDREKRREERVAAEQKAAGSDRRTRLLQLSAGGVFLAIIVVVVIIIVAGSGSDSGGDAENLTGETEVSKLLAGIPQDGTTIGKASAPVTLFEYGDLQCPYCKQYSESFVQELIENQVKNGELKIDYGDFIIIGPQSTPAGEAALAAAAQGKGWNYIELFYRNQGEENSGYVTDEFMESIAKGAGVPNFAKWNEERKSGKYKKTVEETTKEAQELTFEGTPSFAIKGPGSNGIEILNTPGTLDGFEEAIKEAS